jgi:ketosteroid isomerase-like protein
MARLTVVLAVSVGVVLGVSQFGFTGADEREGIRAALERYEHAVSAKDLETCMELFSQEMEPVVIGTGPGERWVGREEIMDAHRHFLSSFDSERSHRTWATGNARGDVAWGAGMFEVTQYLKNVKNEFFLNLTMVFVKEGEEWRVVLLHFSNLTGPDGPEGA